MSIKEQISGFTVPEKTETYSPVPNEYLYDKVVDLLNKRSFEIEEERLIVCNQNVMHIAFRLTSPKDEEIKPSFHVINSYNKSTTLTFAGGAEVVACTNGMVVAETSAKRKHSKKLSDLEIHAILNEQINYLQTWYDQALEFKKKISNFEIDSTLTESLLGQMFYGKKLFTPNVSGAILKEYEPDSISTLWDLYNLVTNNMKTTHLGQYIRNHKNVHDFINFKVDEFLEEIKVDNQVIEEKVERIEEPQIY